KWIGILFGGLIGILLLVGLIMSFITTNRLQKVFNITPTTVNIPNNSSAQERGEYIYVTICAGCHGKNLEGTAFFEDPMIGSIPAPNLTFGQGGLGSNYSDLDYVRAIRHGLSPENKPLIIMPSEAFWYFSDEDLGDLIAYMKSVPAVDNNLGERNIKFMGKILMTAGAFGDIIYAETIAHDQKPPAVPERAATGEYGNYLVNIHHCISCHGENLNGATSSEPGAPFSPNLTPGGVLSTWSADDFINTMQTGVTPLGRQLDKYFMPYEEIGRMTEEDLTAMFIYLQSLPTLATPLK
ncbi:MAG TPA: cytochrome c, partial [Anaerolineaceae bacterium]|nr:cytochrome c [Anaerolineaceae bacterium]